MKAKETLSTKRIIIIVLLVIHLAPIWIFKYFPTQDGPSHIYNAYVLRDYHKHENYKIREVFKLNLAIFPNWASHALMAIFMHVFPPIICEKILLSLCIILTPLSLFYFLNAVDKRKMLFGLIGFMYAYNLLLQMGFYNFALSIPMFFFTLGYWWRHRDEMRLTNIAILYILLLGTYLCHYQSYAQLVLSMSFFAIFSYLYSAFSDTWGYRKESRGSLIAFLRKLKSLFLFLGYMLPAYFIALSYYLESTVGYLRNYWDMETMRKYFFSNKSLVYFRDDHILIMRIFLGFLAVVFLLTLWDRIMAVRKFRKNSAMVAQRLWTKVINGKEQFLLMSAILTFIFFRSPWSLSSGGGWINDRVHIYIFLVVLPFFSVNFHRYIRYTMAGMMITLSLWHLGYTTHDYYYLNKEITEMTRDVGILEEYTSLSDEADLIRGREPGAHVWNAPSEHIGPVKYIAPFLHVPAYYCLENGVAYLANYEARFKYFPVGVKDNSGPVDYVLAWHLDDENKLKKLEGDYDLIRNEKYYRIYRLKSSEPYKSLWDSGTVKFDMQPKDGQTAPGHIAVFNGTFYTEGKYGWVTRPLHEASLSGANIAEPYRDAVWGEDDGVFKVALPNGTYKVTAYFCSGGAAKYKINVIANGKKVIKNLKVPAGNEVVDQNYAVAITNERLTQIIYAGGRDRQKRWVWNGFAIQRVHE